MPEVLRHTRHLETHLPTGENMMASTEWKLGNSRWILPVGMVVLKNVPGTFFAYHSRNRLVKLESTTDITATPTVTWNSVATCLYDGLNRRAKNAGRKTGRKMT